VIHDRQERPTTGIESGRIDVQPESNQRELGQMRPIEDLLLEVEQVQVAGLALATIRATVEPVSPLRAQHLLWDDISPGSDRISVKLIILKIDYI